MKLLFLTDNFPPEVNAPANRTYEHCREWVRLGADVTVITCAPNFPKGEVYSGYKNKFIHKEEIDGIKVIRVWSYITANEGFFKRILDYTSYALMAFFVGLFVKTDLIIATSPQFFTALSGNFLSVIKRKKWVMEVRDLWPESIVAVGAMKENFLIRIFERLELWLYRSANHIVVVTDTFKSKMISRGICKGKISVVKNGANLEMFQKGEKPDRLVGKHQLEGKFVIGYIGTHGMAHGLDFILGSIGELYYSNPEILFLFLGDGAEKRKLVLKAAELRLKNVRFLDSVSKNEVVDYLKVMDVALVNLKRNPTFLTVIPSKIFEAAAMEKPILLGLEGETKVIIEMYQAGLCFVPEDRSSFVSNVKEIALNLEVYRKLQKGCRELAGDFDRKKLAKKMFHILINI